MLKFINENGVLFSGLFGIIGVLLSALFSTYNDKKKKRNNTIKELKERLEKAENDLKKYTIIENQEKNIDKTRGAIYVETLSNGSKREICAYCWEKSRIKIPLVSKSFYNENMKITKCIYSCGNCGSEFLEERVDSI